MRTSIARWVAGGLFVSAVGMFLLLLADSFRFFAQYNEKEFYSYNIGGQGINFQLSDHFYDTPLRDEAAGVRKLYERDFYRTRIAEPTAVRILKKSIPTSVESLFFPNKWELLWYLSFVGDDRALFSALQTGLTEGVFAETTHCVIYTDCKVEEITSTVNISSQEQLIGLIYDDFIDASLYYYQHGAAAHAYRKAIDALELLRLVNFDRNLSFPRYDKALVLATFLTMPRVKSGHISNFAFDNLIEVLGTREPEYQDFSNLEYLDSDPNLSAYVDGIAQLRRRCFWQANIAFNNAAAAANHDPLRELFTFLAIRSLAAPAILEDTRQVDATGTLVVRDCDGSRPFSSYYDQFKNLTELSQVQELTHAGFATDVRYYEQRMHSLGKPQHASPAANGSSISPTEILGVP